MRDWFIDDKETIYEITAGDILIVIKNRLSNLIINDRVPENWIGSLDKWLYLKEIIVERIAGNSERILNEIEEILEEVLDDGGDLKEGFSLPEKEEGKIVCLKCGCAEIETSAWVKVNSKEIVSVEEGKHVYCPVCGRTNESCTEKEFKQKKYKNTYVFNIE